MAIRFCSAVNIEKSYGSNPERTNLPSPQLYLVNQVFCYNRNKAIIQNSVTKSIYFALEIKDPVWHWYFQKCSNWWLSHYNVPFCCYLLLKLQKIWVLLHHSYLTDIMDTLGLLFLTHMLILLQVYRKKMMMLTSLPIIGKHCNNTFLVLETAMKLGKVFWTHLCHLSNRSDTVQCFHDSVIILLLM